MERPDEQPPQVIGDRFMALTIQREIKEALWAMYPPSKRIALLIRLASQDLCFGPIQKGEEIGGVIYPGFGRALDEIQEWFNQHVPSESLVLRRVEIFNGFRT